MCIQAKMKTLENQNLKLVKKPPKSMEIEKMVIGLYEGQKQIQNQISSLIS